MSEWDGQERRVGMVTRDEFRAFVEHSNASRESLHMAVTDIGQSIKLVQCSVKKMESNWDQYAGLLKDTKASVETREKLKSAILEKSLTGAVWAMVVFVALASWDWAKAHLK